MGITELIQGYMEIGILGLCAIFILLFCYNLFKKNNDDSDKKTEAIKHKDELTEHNQQSFINLMQQQMLDFQKQQAKNNEMLINTIINGVTSHVPSVEENARVSHISEQIDQVLRDILNETKASRAVLVQYHNGGKGINKQSFLKMSITNEQVQLGIKPIISEFKDQFRSVLSYFVREIGAKGKCYILDIETLKKDDVGSFEIIRDRGMESKFGIAINGGEDFVIAYLSIEFKKKEDANIEVIDKIFVEKKQIVEALLNL